MKETTELCRGFTDADWEKLRKQLDNGDQASWKLAIGVFERRIRERFLSCIDALIDADTKLDVAGHSGKTPGLPALPDDQGKPVVVPGFAIMALCCLLAETLQSFREKPNKAARSVGPCEYPNGQCIRPGPNMTDQFKKFLKRPAFCHAFDDDKLSTAFIRGVRNGILHEAETRDWVIWRNEPSGCIVGSRGKGYAVNRGEFYRALKCEFNTYLKELDDTDNTQLRKRFVKKMNDIAKEC
jgi:hypothetical protein